MKKRIVYSTLFLSLIFTGIISYMVFMPFSAKTDCSVFIRHGETFDMLCARLDTVAASGRMPMFRLLSVLSGYGKSSPRAGRYKVSGLSTFALLQNLRHGQQEPLRYNIPLVWTPDLLAKRLGTKFLADSADFSATFADSVFLAEFGVTPASLFCIVIPDTYEFYWTLSPEDFVRRMKRESERFWTDERKALAEARGLNPYEVVTLASIVEKETAKDDEKPVVAGLYINRLRKGMKLQADPTVKFAVGDFALRRILNRHLTTPSPYNTYLNAGLPPAPICLPSRASIEAVLHAQTHNYLYMCAREDFSGYHNFAESYAEHSANARRYAQALNERGIR